MEGNFWVITFLLSHYIYSYNFSLCNYNREMGRSAISSLAMLTGFIEVLQVGEGNNTCVVELHFAENNINRGDIS